MNPAFDTDHLAMPLPGLRQDLHVRRVGSFRDGSPRYRIHDPLRNRYFELGMLDLEVLAQWRGGDNAPTVANRAGKQLGTPVEPGEVLALRDFLVRHQLIDAGGGPNFTALRGMWHRTRPPWLTWLLHHYLFFRIPLARPDAWLLRMLPAARMLVSPMALGLLLMLAIVTPVLLAREWDEYKHSFAGLLTFDGILASAIAAFVAKILHELGHAFVARHHGARVPVMGVAFLVLWPVLYTDTSDSWKLEDSKARLRIAAAGVATELCVALVCLFLWTLAPPGGLRSALFFLSTTSVLITLSINASPFMRLDGYFVLSDALDFPNLHERSSAMARWWLRKQLWGLRRAPPERHGRGFDAFLVAFALATWIYRAAVFVGVALLVYFAFFKVLGILLMLVELGWFIAKPVWSEASALWMMRGELKPRWGRLAFLAALLMAREESRIYAPVPAQIEAMRVRPGQEVAAGDVLLELNAPDLVYRSKANGARIERAEGELARIPASDRQRDRSLVLQEELAQAMAEQQAISAELGLLTIRAGHGGHIADMPSDVAPGRWISPRRLLGRVVNTKQSQVRAWVSETQVRRLAVGNKVSFVPRRAEQPIREGEVVRIDTRGSRVLPHPLLDGRHRGDLAAQQDARGEWMLRETLYQVDVQINGAAPAAVEPGRLVVPTGAWDALSAATRHSVTVLVRESGF